MIGAPLLSVAGVTGVAWYAYRSHGPFRPTHFIWSRGLALLCDRNGGLNFVRRQRGGRPPVPFDPAAYANIRRGELVWVRQTALPEFVRQILPSIKEPFGLVTGDEDGSMPTDFDGANELLSNRFLAHWFAQNNDGTNTTGKVSGVPIGMDFHTISNSRKWGHWRATPSAQEAQLRRLLQRLPPTASRDPHVHADFHLNKGTRRLSAHTRAEVEAVLRANPLVVFQDQKARRLDLWRDRARFAFVASPHGNGLDCHRTWEALVLGHIPIVRTSSLDPLYEQLPVAIVNDWGEVTEDRLARWQRELSRLFTQKETQQRLTNHWWITHMRSVLAKRL